MSINNRPYKPTGNLAVDVVAECINHYGKFGKQVEHIVLHPKMWGDFCAFVKAQIPEYDFSDETVHFDDVIVRKGTTLMIKDIYWELKKPKMELVN